LLRIIQESLANVHRHAAATQVSINLRCIGGSVHLVVRDDGGGIAMANGEQASLGVGLPGMAMRVRQLGGKLEVNSSVRVTTVHASIPFRRTNAEAAY
jgi:two-component system, NarL family, sensor kinase